MTTPQPNQFLVQPINDFDLIVVFRGSDISRPLYMTYKDLLSILTAAISGGSPLLLQTNSVNNPIQDVLNIIEGTGMSIVDNGDGSVTFNATGGGSVTADNGLTETTGNVQWGGTLIQNTTIAANLFDILFTGTKPSRNAYVQTIQNAIGGSGLRISVIGNGHAARFTAVNGEGIIAESNTGDAVYALANTTGTALLAESIAGRAIEALSFTDNIFRLRGGGAGVIDTILTLIKSGALGAINGGVSIDFKMINSSSAEALTARIASVFSDPSNLNEDAELHIYTINNGTVWKIANFKSNGQLQLDKYGVNTFTGTPAYYLGVDASGNVIEVTPSGGGGSLLNDTTGILFGGVLSATIGGIIFSVTAGIGQIVTQTASISGVVTTVTNVTWSAVVGAAITNIATSQFTYVLVNSSGVVIQQTTPFTDAQYKTHIIIGIICHINLASVNLVTNAQNVAYEDPHRLVELISTFGAIKKSGLNISANGANLRVNRTSGEAFKIGSNYITDQFEPDVRTIAAQTPALLCRVYRNGSGGFIFDVNGGLYYNDIDPNQYDDGSGTLQSVGGSKWTIQRLFFFPNNPADIICYYGTQVYNQFSEARANLEFETFDEAQITAENAVFLGFLFVRNAATNLSLATQAVFLQSGLFRGIPAGGGGSGGGGGITSLNAQTGATQTFANGTSGTAPAFVSALDVHTLNIPLANTVGVTAGLVSNSQVVKYENAVYPFVAQEYISGNLGSAIINVGDIIFAAYTSGNQVIATNKNTGIILSTTTVTPAIGLVHVQLISEVWCFNTAGTIARFNALTGAFIANTTVTGLTAGCRGVYDDSLVTGNVFAYFGTTMNVINALTFIRTGVSLSGTNAGSYELTLATGGLQSGLLIGVNNGGVFGFNKTTNTQSYFTAVFTNGGYIKYIPSINKYVASQIGGNRLFFLEPTTATTLTLTTAINGILTPYQFEFDETENKLLVVSAAPIQTPMKIHVIELTTLSWIKATLLTTITTSSGSFVCADKVNKTLYVVGTANGGGIAKVIYA